MKTPRAFYQPLAIGAPAPLRATPVRLERMIHFVPPQIDKMRGESARSHPQRWTSSSAILKMRSRPMPKRRRATASSRWPATTTSARPACGPASTASTPPGRSTTSLEIVTERRPQARRHHAAQGRGRRGISTISTSCLPSSRPRRAFCEPILIHAILETAEGVANVEAIADASPRMHGMSLGPADLAASRGMKTTRVGGGHPAMAFWLTRLRTTSPRPPIQQDLWHYTVAKMVDACLRCRHQGLLRAVRRFFRPGSLRSQFRNAFLMGCLGAWSLHPTRSTSPSGSSRPIPDEVAFASNASSRPCPMEPAR